MNNETLNLSLTARFAKWTIRKVPWNSSKAIKIGAYVWLVAAIFYILLGINKEAENAIFMGLSWLMCALIHFLKSGFCELIEKGYKQD